MFGLFCFLALQKLSFSPGWTGVDFFSLVVKTWQGTLFRAVREMVCTRMSVALSAPLCVSMLQLCQF